MLTIQNLSYELGGRWLYRDINWQVSPRQRIGLIGKNGTGKTTLLKLIHGDLKPTEGSIARPRDLRMGFLNQDLLSFQSEGSIFEVALGAFKEQLEMERRMDEVTAQLETRHHDGDLMQELVDVQMQYQLADGYEIRPRVYEVLAGLGFGQEDCARPYSAFSGGWRMRVMLARMLLQKPDLLLLDEPTNHLDLPSIRWVEQYTQSFAGSIIIVSHDRTFLDRSVEIVAEIAHQRIDVYHGNYSFYLEEKELRKGLQQSAYDNQQKSIRESERFVERFRYKASKAKQAQSRLKLLDKLDRVEAPDSDEAGIRLRFPVKRKPGQDITQLKIESKRFGELEVLHQAKGHVRRGDKIGLIGPNGVGKSTLLRVINGSEPFDGDCQLGYNVDISFFAQHQLEALNMKQSIWDEVYGVSGLKTDGEVRSLLGCFLFSGDDVAKKIGVLSGGEKSRVALAKTLLQEANFLLLDEPTNHLDIQSIHVLAEALKSYDGTFLLVSHDRYFLGLVTNKIWYIEDKEIKEYPGGYIEFQQWQLEREKAPETKTVANKPSKQVADESSKQRKQLQNKLKKHEETIAQLEAEKETLLAKMGTPEISQDFAKLCVMQEDVAKLERRLVSATKEWEGVYVELEALG